MDELLQKYIEGNASDEETQKVMDWLRDDRKHLDEYRRRRKLYDITLWNTEADKDRHRIGRQAHNLFRTWLRVAAIIVIAFATGYFYQAHRENGMCQKQTVVVPEGQHAELYLADGTHVWLNSGSRLTFPGQFAEETRRVELDGEGYFKVAANKRCPFIVGTKEYGIRVLGTEFNVLAYREDSVWETTLVNGAVEILTAQGDTPLMRMEAGTTAKSIGGRLVKEPFRHPDYLRWREGLLCFDNISLRDMIEKLKLYYDVNFIVENSHILEARYTGKFRINDGIEHVMRVLSLNNNFAYSKDEESNTITIY